MSVFIIVKSGWTFLELRKEEKSKQFSFDWPMETLTHKKMLREGKYKINYLEVLSQFGEIVDDQQNCKMVEVKLSEEEFEKLWRKRNKNLVINKTIQILNEIEYNLYLPC